MDAGELVPDDLICAVIEERLDSGEADDGFLLDGFPRTIGQAEVLEEALDKRGRGLTAVLLIDAPDEEVVRRLSGRRTCVKNGHVYHVEFDPPKNEGVCDQDGSRLMQRDDDKPETVQKRLEVYHEQTEPLIEWYEERGLLRRFDGTRTPEEVHSHIRATLATLALEADLVIQLKTPERDRADGRRRAGSSPAATRSCARRRAPGVTTAELDEAAERFIRSQGAEPAFKGYRGFPGSICASPNSMVVHGIPGAYELQARRHPLDRHRRDPRRLGGRRRDHAPDRQRHADRAARCWPPPAARCSTRSSSAGSATASATSRTRCRRASRATASR